jgi:hypothetical protein
VIAPRVAAGVSNAPPETRGAKLDPLSEAEDPLGRPRRDTRISVIDRCDLRCPYCTPAEVFGIGRARLPRADLLTFEEIVRLARMSSVA